MFNAYHKWLGIPPCEQPPHHCRLLAITAFESDPDVIDAAANRQMAFLLECSQGPHVAEAQSLLNDVSAARLTLLNPRKKVAYDMALRAAARTPTSSTPLVVPAWKAEPRISSAPLGVGVALALAMLLVGLVWHFSAQPVSPDSPELASLGLTGLTQAPTAPPVAPRNEESKSVQKVSPDLPSRPAPPVSAPPTLVQEPDERRGTSKVSGSGPDLVFRQERLRLEPQAAGPGLLAPPKPTANESGTRVALVAEPAKDPPVRSRTPVPAKEALFAVQELIKGLFKAEYSSRKTDERVALAKKLLSQGIETSDDPTSQYVLLCEARDVAASIGETDTALKAVEELIKRFEMEPGEIQFQALSELSKSVRTAESNQTLLDRSIVALDGAIDVDDFESAKKLATLGGAVAKKAQNVKAVSQMAARIRDIDTMKKEFDKVKEAQAVLKVSPEDPAANLVAGRYLSFIKGDFEKGLGCLAKGGDEGFKALAARELAVPAEPAEQLAIADQWWAQAEKEREPAKSNIQGHAVHWYAKALPSLKGLPKTQIEAKIKSFSAEKPEKTRDIRNARGFTVGSWALKWTNGSIEKVRWDENGKYFHGDRQMGTWKLEGNSVIVKFNSDWQDQVFKYTHPDRIEGRVQQAENAATSVGTRLID